MATGLSMMVEGLLYFNKFYFTAYSPLGSEGVDVLFFYIMLQVTCMCPSPLT